MKDKQNPILSLIPIYAIIIWIIISLLSGCAINKKQTLTPTDVNGTVQKFPMEITKEWSVTRAFLNEEFITITLINKNGEEYTSELDSKTVEEVVCDKASVYDCSSEDKIVESMIKKLAKDSIDLIEGSN